MTLKSHLQSGPLFRRWNYMKRSWIFSFGLIPGTIGHSSGKLKVHTWTKKEIWSSSRKRKAIWSSWASPRYKLVWLFIGEQNVDSRSVGQKRPSTQWQNVLQLCWRCLALVCGMCSAENHLGIRLASLNPQLFKTSDHGCGRWQEMLFRVPETKILNSTVVLSQPGRSGWRE
jgi:hypothetical protein